jgi:hypothetical protein
VTAVDKNERVLRRRRRVAALWAALRVLAGSVVVFGLYFGLPFRNIDHVSGWLMLAFMLAVFVALMAWQIRRIIEADDPRMRAVEALAVSIPLLLASFAIAHFLISQSTPSAYTESLTRMDSMYFSVTIFSTVGFGDISAVSESARVVVTIQMITDLIVLGGGVRIIFGAVEVGRERSMASRPAGDVVEAAATGGRE